MKFFAEVILSLIIGCITPYTLSAQELKFTIPLPLTGTQGKFGHIEKNAYELAMKEINEKGGIKGHRIDLAFEDSQGKPEISKAIAEKLIGEKRQPLLFGEYSSACSLAIAAVAEQRKTPYLVVTGAADEISQGTARYVFRMNPANAYYAVGMLSFFKEVVKPQSVVILYESSPFGTSGALQMALAFHKARIPVLQKEKYDKGTVDFRPLLSRVQSKKPDVLYMISYVEDAALMMKQVQELRYEAKLFAGGAAGFAIPEFIQYAREASEYVVTAALWSPQVNYPGAREFAEKYRNHFGDYPSYHGAEAYSTLYVIQDVLTRSKSWNPEDVREAMKLTDLMTVFGPIKFEDREGYTNQNFIETLVMQVIDGRHETIWPLKYASRRYIYPIPRWSERIPSR